MTDSASKPSVPAPAKKIYRKGDAFVCGMCHMLYPNVEYAKECLLKDWREHEKKNSPPSEEKKFRCGRCRGVHPSKELARECAARCKQKSEGKAPNRPEKVVRTRRRTKVGVPHWAFKKCMQDGGVLVCKRCGSEYTTVKDVVTCFDIHPPLPPGQKPKVPDRMKYRTVGDQYQCRYCVQLCATVEEVVVCYDSHDEEREARLREKERKSRRDRDVKKEPRNHARGTKQLEESYTLGERTEGDEDDGYDIFSDPYAFDDEGYTIDGNWRSPSEGGAYTIDGEGDNTLPPRPVVKISGYSGSLRMDKEGYVLDRQGNPLHEDKDGYFVDAQGGRLQPAADGYVIDSQGQRYGADEDGYLIEANWASPKTAESDYTITSSGPVKKSKDVAYTIESGGPLKRKASGYTIESSATNHIGEGASDGYVSGANLEYSSSSTVQHVQQPLVLPDDVPFSDYSDLREFGDEQLIAQPDEARVSPEQAAKRRAERHKFMRTGTKYQCKACGTRFYLKVQVIACFDGHKE